MVSKNAQVPAANFANSIFKKGTLSKPQMGQHGTFDVTPPATARMLSISSSAISALEKQPTLEKQTISVPAQTITSLQ